MGKIDMVQPFQLEKSDIKGRLGLVSTSVSDILRNKDYPNIVSKLVAEASLVTSLIGQSMKLNWKLSLQIRGKGPIKLIATDYFNFGNEKDCFKVRGHASFDRGYNFNEKYEMGKLFGDGYFAIIIDQGAGSEPYKGITPLSGDSLSACAENFFHQSEQLPTRFEVKLMESNEIGSKTTMRVGGIMLQYLAQGTEMQQNYERHELTNVSSADLLTGVASEKWRRVNIFLDTLTTEEFFDESTSSAGLLYRLFNEERPIVYAKRNIEFGCTCSPDKVKQTMSIYSSKDIEKMTNSAGKVTAECQFCGENYSFNPSALGINSQQ